MKKQIVRVLYYVHVLIEIRHQSTIQFTQKSKEHKQISKRNTCKQEESNPVGDVI